MNLILDEICVCEEKTVSVTKIWNPNFISLLLVNFLMYFGVFISNTILPKYANFLGATPVIVGTVTSLFSISALAIRPFSAPATDRVNKKYLFIIAILFIILANLGYYFATTIPLLMVARLIHGLGMGITSVLCMVMTCEALPEEKMTTGIGIFGASGALASAVGPSFGIYIQEHYGYQTAFLSAVLSLAVCIIGICILKTSKPQKNPNQTPYFAIKNIFAFEATIPALCILFLSIAYTTYISFIVLYSIDIGVKGIGAFFTIYAITLLVSRPLSGRLTDKFGLAAIYLPATLFLSSSFVIVSFAKSLPVFLIAAFFTAIGFGSCQPIIQSMTVKSVSPNRRGAASSTFYVGTDLGFLIGPILAGVLVQTFGYSNMYRLEVIPVAIAVAIFYFGRKKFNKVSH